jgi:hypothetical protein
LESKKKQTRKKNKKKKKKERKSSRCQSRVSLGNFNAGGAENKKGKETENQKDKPT